jgi:hypothetical protein
MWFALKVARRQLLASEFLVRTRECLPQEQPNLSIDFDRFTRNMVMLCKFFGGSLKVFDVFLALAQLRNPDASGEYTVSFYLSILLKLCNCSLLAI